MEISYNLNKLIKIKVANSSVADEFFYVKESKSWFGKPIPAHIEHVVSPMCGYLPIDALPEAYFIKNEVLYEKAYCRLNFQGEIHKTLYFDSYQEALNKAEELRKKSGNNYLIIN